MCRKPVLTNFSFWKIILPKHFVSHQNKSGVLTLHWLQLLRAFSKSVNNDSLTLAAVLTAPLKSGPRWIRGSWLAAQSLCVTSWTPDLPCVAFGGDTTSQTQRKFCHAALQLHGCWSYFLLTGRSTTYFYHHPGKQGLKSIDNQVAHISTQRSAKTPHISISVEQTFTTFSLQRNPWNNFLVSGNPC